MISVCQCYSILLSLLIIGCTPHLYTAPVTPEYTPYTPSYKQATDQFNQELIMATFEGNLTRINHLLNLPTISINECNPYHHTALMVAAYYGHEAIVTTLLNAHADPTMIDSYEKTALMYAQQRGHNHIIKALMNADTTISSPTAHKK